MRREQLTSVRAGLEDKLSVSTEKSSAKPAPTNHYPMTNDK
ncbi:hypothetical protein QUB80_17830 [Chlorogloeopsis sp. ULAP01]|nr:hypothetical protein [Chlorogloeopsis sp. ULAP01]MDM9382562.1 hypothetical protein [Chlorogloeopsis sp. ULAP01]